MTKERLIEHVNIIAGTYDCKVEVIKWGESHLDPMEVRQSDEEGPVVDAEITMLQDSCMGKQMVRVKTASDEAVIVQATGTLVFACLYL